MVEAVSTASPSATVADTGVPEIAGAEPEAISAVPPATPSGGLQHAPQHFNIGPAPGSKQWVRGQPDSETEWSRSNDGSVDTQERQDHYTVVEEHQRLMEAEAAAQSQILENDEDMPPVLQGGSPIAALNPEEVGDLDDIYDYDLHRRRSRLQQVHRSARMNVTAQPKPMDSTATSSTIPPTESQTSLAAMMHMMNHQNNGEVTCQCAENILARMEAENMVLSSDSRRLAKLISQRQACSKQLEQRKQELFEAQRQLECTRQQIARSSKGAGC